MASIASTTAPGSSTSSNGQTYRGPFTIMTVLFFLWGFMTVFKIADILLKGGNEHGLQISFIVPMIAYAYVAFYGLIGHKIGRQTQALTN